MGSYHTPLDLVRERSPERPVALVRPGAVALAARWFQDNFKGDVFYAVKANPSPWVIRTLAENGVASFDVASISEIELVAAHAPGKRMAFMHPVKSRAAIAVPEGFEAQVRPRSGLAIRSGVTCLNTPGTIDADYRGEVKVILINLGEEDFVIRRGERIAQLVIAPVIQASWSEVEGLDETTRGAGGFGSTGQG